MEYRNPVFIRDGRIDIELKHPVYGWIPFTADPDDPEPYGRELYADALEHADPYVEPEPQPEPVPKSVSRMQARIAIEQAGLTQKVDDAIAAADPITKIAWEDARTFERTSTVMLGVAEAIGLTADELDDLFKQAAAIEVG